MHSFRQCTRSLIPGLASEPGLSTALRKKVDQETQVWHSRVQGFAENMEASVTNAVDDQELELLPGNKPYVSSVVEKGFPRR